MDVFLRLKGKTHGPWMYEKFTMNVTKGDCFLISKLLFSNSTPKNLRLHASHNETANNHQDSVWWTELSFCDGFVERSATLWEKSDHLHATRPISHQDLAQKMEMEHGRMGDSLAKLQENGTRPVMPPCHAFAIPLGMQAGPKAVGNIPELFQLFSTFFLLTCAPWTQISSPCARSLTKMRMENMKP